jgi:hypothetical protein
MQVVSGGGATGVFLAEYVDDEWLPPATGLFDRARNWAGVDGEREIKAG